MANETDPMIGVGSETENSHEMHTIGQNGTERIEERQAANDTNNILDCVKKSSINIDTLTKLIESGANVNSHDKDDKRTALHEASLKGEVEVVDVLLQAGAHIEYKDEQKNTALHYAVQSGSEKACEVFKRLLPPKEKLEKICGTGLVHKTTKSGKHYTQTKSEYWIDTAVSVNKEGFNVLDLALEKITTDTNNKINEERRNIVRYIVRETGLYCLLRLLRNNTGRTFSTPFRGLIEMMPEVAVEVMNKCIKRKRSEITFHYEFLDDTYFLKEWPPDHHDDYPSTWEHRLLKDTEKLEAYTNTMKKMKTNHPLWLMIDGKLTDRPRVGIYQQLLDHPLVVALVSRKWNHFGEKIHSVNFVLYLIYLVVLTACVSTTVPPYMHSQSQSDITTFGNTSTDPNVTMSPAETTCQNTTTCLNKTTLENPEAKLACNSFKSDRKLRIADMQYLVIGLSIIMILKEVYQLFRMYGREYFKQKENYVELAVYISSVLFAVNVTDCENTDYRTNWQWILATFSIPLAWTHVLTYAKKISYLGTYVLMLWTISKTFLTKVFPIVAVFLIALATAFYCVFQNQDEFGNFGHSILATSSFMVGGFEYGEFKGFVDNNNLAPVGYIIYSLFLIITIIVLNLMVGEAVQNVEKIHKLACDTRFALQIKYVLEFEGIICFVSSKLEKLCGIFKLKKWFLLKPNEAIRLKGLQSRGLQVQQILDLIDKTKETKAKEGKNGLHEEITTIKDEILSMKAKIDELSTIKDEVLNIKEMLSLPSKDLANTNKTSTNLN